MKRRFRFVMLLVVALFWGQIAVVLHDLGHATEGIEKHDSAPDSNKCDRCGLFAELSGALGVTAPVAAFVLAFVVATAVLAQRNATLAPRYRSRSRGPPPALA